MMSKDARIYVAGHRGLAGSAIVRRLRAHGYENLVLRGHDELELTDQPAVRAFFESEKPDYVFVAAAKVGGIMANHNYPAEFIHQNLAIQTNVIHESWRSGVNRLVYLGSSCVYPRDCPQPIREEYLLTGPLESTNRPYAVAKIAGIEMCWSYNRQYGTRYLSVMPTNLYGPGERFDVNYSHVMPALMRRLHEAKKQGETEFVVWGSGTPRREFLYSDDMAEACVFLMNLVDSTYSELVGPESLPVVNVGSGDEVTIRQLVETLMTILGVSARLVFDAGKPDGTPRKLLDSSKLKGLGWSPCTPLSVGIPVMYQDFLARFG